MTHQAPGTGRLEKWDKAWVLNEASLKEFQGRPEVRVEARSVGWGERGSLGWRSQDREPDFCADELCEVVRAISTLGASVSSSANTVSE